MLGEQMVTGADIANLKQQMFGRYQGYEDQVRKLGLTAARKSLDIPEDDMNINAPKTTINHHYDSGKWNWVMAALVGIAGMGVGAGAYALGTLPKTPPAAIDFDAVEQVLQPNGEWKPTGNKTRMTKQPDGSWK